jgi:hypothetical protein
MSNPTVKEILKSWLKEHGYDGLFNEWGECGCELNDLAPCGEIDPECKAGYKAVCEGEERCEACELGVWHIQADKPRGKE